MLRDKHDPDATSNSSSSSSSSSSDLSLSSSYTDSQGVSLSLVKRPQQLSAFECVPRMDPKMDFCDSFNRDTNNQDKMATRQASLVACQEEPEHEQTLKLQPSPPSSCSMEEGPLITKHADGAAVPTIKRRNVGVPKFLRFLFQILEEEDPVIITWSHEGTAFQINQPDDLATQILPKYFKHNKVSSFQRQLNYFGFKKWTKTQTNVCTFSHPFFYRADKDKMKLIKRKERAHAAAAASDFSANMTTTIDLESIDNTKTSHDHELAPGPTQIPFEAYDLAGCPQRHLPAQQALKRQKSTTLSGATVTFLNSGAAGRRHSTGMLPGSEALGLAAAAAAAASGAAPSAIAGNFVLGRKRVGTPAEQEFELEMEARSHAATNSPSGPQMSMHMRKIVEHQELSQQYSYPPVYGKRQSLPHVLAPGFANTFGIGMNNSANGMGNGGIGARSANILSRRRSDQARADHDNVDAALDNGCSRLENLMSSSSKSAFQQTAVLPISSELAHNADLQQQQQQWQVRQQGGQQLQSGRVTGYGVKTHSGSEWPASMKSEASNGWLTSINSNAGSVGSSLYSTHSQDRTMPMSFLPRGSSAPSIVNPSFHGNSSMDHLHTTSAGDRKLQLRAHMSHPHDNHFYQQQATSYQPQEEQHEKKEPQLMTQHPRDYIDVLLENAGLDDGLTSQSSTMLSSELWNAHSESEARCSGSTGSFAYMQPQQNGMQQLQLSPMGDMSNQPNQRF